MMPSAPTVRVARLLLGCVLGAFCIVSSDAIAGEKIKFSEPDDKAEMPGKGVRDDLLSNPLDFLKSRGSDGGSMAPEFPKPNLSPLLPRGKSADSKWMFDSNGKLDQEAALKQIFKIKDYNLDDWQKKRDSESESMFGEQPEQDDDLRQNSIDSKGNRSQVSAANGYRGNSRYERDQGPDEAPNPELDFNRLLESTRDPLSMLPGDSIRTPPLLGNTLNPLGRQPLPTQAAREKERQRELQSQALDKLLGPRPYSGSPINDLLPSTADSTRQEINPITGRRMDERSLGNQRNTPDVFGSINLTPRASASSPLDGLPSKAPGSSVAPSFGPPPAVTPPIQNKPTTFEIPRRKF